MNEMSHPSPGDKVKLTAHLPFLKRAKRYGTYCVFETAVEQRIGILELAELVKGLRQLQKDKRHNWYGGMPFQYDKRGHLGSAGNLWRSPDGILGDYKEVMVKALLSLNCPNSYIVDRLGVKKEYVQQVRCLAIEEDEGEIKQSRRDFVDCCAA